MEMCKDVYVECIHLYTVFKLSFTPLDEEQTCEAMYMYRMYLSKV